MRDSAKAKRARDLCKKWGAILDSIEPSLIVFDGGMQHNHLNSRDTVASFAEQVIKYKINDPRNPIKRPKIQATKEMTLKTTSEIFCSHPTKKQRLVDIVADPINRYPSDSLLLVDKFGREELLSPKLVYQEE